MSTSTGLIQLTSVAGKKKYTKKETKTKQVQKPPHKPEPGYLYNIQEMYEEHVKQGKTWTKEQFEAFFRQLDHFDIIINGGRSVDDILQEGIEDIGWGKFESGRRVVVFCYSNRSVVVMPGEYYDKPGYFGLWSK
jgi:hypothetical protein